MMSPHTHVALTRIRDEEEARKALRRPDALPDPEERPAEVEQRRWVRARFASYRRATRSVALPER